MGPDDAVGADDLDAALSAVVGMLSGGTDRDWTVPAGELDWDCWHTAEHVGDVLLSYALQLVARPDGRYVRFTAAAEPGASPAEVLEFAEAGARVLASVLRTTPPDVRADHPSGRADRTGFAAMGCAETLLHGADIAAGLGLEVDPPREVCARVLRRLFPDLTVEGDAWLLLRWAHGRIALPDRPRRTDWRWHGDPPPAPPVASHAARSGAGRGITNGRRGLQ